MPIGHPYCFQNYFYEENRPKHAFVQSNMFFSTSVQAGFILETLLSVELSVKIIVMSQNSL